MGASLWLYRFPFVLLRFFFDFRFVFGFEEAEEEEALESHPYSPWRRGDTPLGCRQVLVSPQREIFDLFGLFDRGISLWALKIPAASLKISLRILFLARQEPI